jgi:hypothetical protein
MTERRIHEMSDVVYDYDASHAPFLEAVYLTLPRRPPPSRYQRLRWRLRAAHERAGDAWRVLRHGLPEQDW